MSGERAVLSTYEEERDLGGVADDLERGHIVHFPEAPVRLPDERVLAELREALPRQIQRKNVSYHPEAGRVVGFEGDAALGVRVRAVLVEHAAEVQAFLRRVLGPLTDGWTVGTTSFRPLEERGRGLKPHASNELVHVDAGAYGATNGDRILRFFVNVNPTEDRVWATRGTFADLYGRWGRAAGVARRDPPASYLEKGIGDRLRTRALGGLAAAGLPLAKVLDSSPYDRTMRRFHNFMKDDATFIAADDGYREFRFAPGSAWMVFTDMVSHACLAGQHALVSTFIVPIRSCRHPELSPLAVLRAGVSG